MTTSVETKLGTISVDICEGGEYPGIWLSLDRDGDSVGLALLEVVQPEGEEPRLAIRVWDPKDPWDDPVYSLERNPEDVNKMFE